MRRIDLLPGITPSVLGFGCAPILGSVDGPKARVALEKAYELGINYFDIAPSYGFGEAEEFLGKFLLGKRTNCIVASKFGIEAHPAARFLSPLKGLVRVIRRGRRPSDNTPQNENSATSRLLPRVPITPTRMKQSVERSLRRLRTDHLDILLIHEPAETVSGFEELLRASSQLKSEGKILAFGLATGFADLKKTHSNISSRLDILQLGCPLLNDELEVMEVERGDKSNILYGATRSIAQSRHVSVPESLALASKMFPKSVVLCSMFNPVHIAENCERMSSS
jgi:aryl-alcohol dehydrogenase-like predicted oxidoreductase